MICAISLQVCVCPSDQSMSHVYFKHLCEILQMWMKLMEAVLSDSVSASVFLSIFQTSREMHNLWSV